MLCSAMRVVCCPGRQHSVAGPQPGDTQARCADTHLLRQPSRSWRASVVAVWALMSSSRSCGAGIRVQITNTDTTGTAMSTSIISTFHTIELPRIGCTRREPMFADWTASQLLRLLLGWHILEHLRCVTLSFCIDSTRANGQQRMTQRHMRSSSRVPPHSTARIRVRFTVRMSAGEDEC